MWRPVFHCNSPGMYEVPKYIWLIKQSCASLLDVCLQHIVGHSVPPEKFGADRSVVAGFGGEQRRSEEFIRRSAKSGGEQTQELPAAHWKNPFGFHVYYLDKIRWHKLPAGNALMLFQV